MFLGIKTNSEHLLSKKTKLQVCSRYVRLLAFSAYIQVTMEKEQMANIEDFCKTWALTKEKTDN